ncbi:hypothetical protein EWM64_g5098, partial [Hericium alpestre]
TIFRNKDDKKGQQDSLKFYLQEELGYVVDSLEMSNTRYQSHCRASAELLVNWKLYVDYLLQAKDRKEKRTFTNLELNVYKALHDILTITELCVLTLYSQSISHPYLREVRSADQKHTNVLDLGPLHEKVIAHCRKIIENSDILLASDATHEEGTLDGQNWERPEAFYVVQKLKGDLPHLSNVLVAFFEGALETWERFVKEYMTDGSFASLTPSLCAQAWMQATNDDNEGTLGSY